MILFNVLPVMETLGLLLLVILFIYLFISITYIQLALGYYLQEYDKNK